MRFIMLLLLLSSGLLTVPPASAACDVGDVDCALVVAAGVVNEAYDDTRTAVDRFCTDMKPACDGGGECFAGSDPLMDLYECSGSPVVGLLLEAAFIARDAVVSWCRDTIDDSCL